MDNKYKRTLHFRMPVVHLMKLEVVVVVVIVIVWLFGRNVKTLYRSGLISSAVVVGIVSIKVGPIYAEIKRIRFDYTLKISSPKISLRVGPR